MKRLVTVLLLTWLSCHVNAQFVYKATYGTNTGVNFYYPSGVKFFNNKIYVADDLNNRVVALNTLGGIVFTFGGTGSGNGQFSRAWNLDINPQNQNIYVSDYINNRVQVFDINGNYLSQFGSTGTGNGQFTGPQGIFIDNNGKVFVVDVSNTNSLLSRIEILSTTGAYLNSIYYGASSSNFDHLEYPSDVTLDQNGNIYVADNGAYRVQIFDKNYNYITRFGTFGSGNGQFNAPSGIAVDNNGKILVTDFSNSRVQVFENNGTYINSFGTSTLNKPYAIDLDNNGNIYITDFNNSVYRFGYPQISLKSNNNSSVIDFGTIKKGQTPGPQYLSVYNTGQASFSVTGISYPPGVSGSDLSNHIYPPNPLSANYYVYLDPTVTGIGNYLGVITITSQGMGNYYINVKANIIDLSNGLVAYYPFDGDARDYSGHGYDMSISNASASADKNGSALGAYQFNGSSSLMTTKTAVDFGNSTTMGFSLWVNSQVYSNTYFVWQGQFGMLAGSASASLVMVSGATNSASGAITPYQWTHLAGYYDGNYIKLYVNGTLTGSTYQPGKSFNASNSISLGTAGANYWTGSLDEIAFYNRALTDGEITALYNGQAPVNIVKPSTVNLQTGVVAYYPFNGDANDQTINAYNLSVTGATLTTDRNSNANGAYYFNGTSDKMTSVKSPDFGNSSVAGFSVWVNTNQPGSSYFLYQNVFGLQATVNQLGMTMSAGNTNTAYAPNTAATWKHFAGYFDGEYIKIYVNGTFSGSAYRPGGTFTTNILQVGYSTPFGYWNGTLDDIVLYNRVLTDNEIMALYNGQTINVKPVSNFSVSAPLCPNTPITFSDVSTISPITRTWQFQGGNITTSQQGTPLVTYANSGVYPVTITSSNVFGAGTSLIKNITVNGLPTVGAGSAISICKGSTVTLSGTGALTYTWTGGVMNNQPFIPLVAATYSVTGTNAFGCVNISSVGITFKPVTTITSPITSQTICGGNLGSFAVSASGVNLSYLWNTGSASAAIATSLPGSYMVTVSGTCGTSISNQATLTALSLTTILAQPVSQTICGGNLGSFTISASGANLSYLWSNGSTTATIAPSLAGTYLATISGACGTSISNQVTLASLPVTTILTQPTSLSVCGGNLGSFAISASGTNLSYQWNTGSTATTIATSLAGSYFVTVSGTCGTSVSGQVSLTLTPLTAILTQPVTQSVCGGNLGSFTISASGANLSYLWSDGSGSSAFNTSTAGIYQVTVSGTCGVAVSNAATLVVPAVITVTSPPTDGTLCYVIINTTTGSTLTGINSGSDVQEKIIIYPNPNTGSFYVEIPAGGTSYLIVNSIGEVVKEGYFATGITKVTLGVSPGIYILKTGKAKSVILVE